MAERRHSDPEGVDFLNLRSYRYASAVPAWARLVSAVGAPTLIAFYLLGMLPGLRSPFDKFADEFKAAASALERHDQTSRESQRVMKLMCAGIWKDQPAVSRSCYGGGYGQETR